MPARRILIIDDNRELRTLVRLTLQTEGYELHEAASADEGLRLAGELRPDLVLLDYMMPGELNGVEACRALRNDPRLAGIRILMISARAQARDVALGIEAGADVYLSKPFSPAQLAAQVQTLLQPAG